MMLTGVVGLYVGRIHAEVKGRPLYVVNEQAGFDPLAAVEPLVAEPQGELDLDGFPEPLAEQRERLVRYAAR